MAERSRRVRGVTLPVLGSLLLGCASGFEQSVDLFYRNRMEASAESFEGYGDRVKRRDQLVYYLNASVPHQVLDDYEASNGLLEPAVRHLDVIMTRSVTGEAGRFLVNEGTVDFTGEPFERARIHYFKSLNYALDGDLEGALVEARRLDLFLGALRAARNGRDAYSEDGYLRYWTGLLYEAAGETNDAFIAYRKALDLYAEQFAFTGVRAPADLPASALRTARALGFDEPAATIARAYPGVDVAAAADSAAAAAGAADSGAVVVVLHAGRAPRKVSRSTILPSHEGIPVKVAFPQLVHYRNSGGRTRVLVGESPAEPLVLVDDVASISEQALGDRKKAIAGRLVARAVAKEVAAQQARAKSGALAEIAVRLAGAATEKADTRGWDTLPAQVYVARLRLPPGRHDVSLALRNLMSPGITR